MSRRPSPRGPRPGASSFGLGALLLLAQQVVLAAGQGSPPGIAAVETLLDRVLPGSRPHFDLRLVSQCKGLEGESHCYQLEDDGVSGRLVVAATGPSELSAGVGHYLRQYCNLTVGWPRGGGSYLGLPAAWPSVGTAVVRARKVPYSYMMNVCTHSYSLVWYDWADWERFIDWMALSGINNVLAMTGQEEVQYKVFRQLGLSDAEIRGWFNGPAFLTWSRGQNEYGAGIAGPLPRSWMKGQWELQRKILARYRELGIIGQLPGFQGNVPVGLKAALADANVTASGATGWMNSVDPAYGKVADLWMKTMIADFGTDHWYQLDGYFNGGTAPWLLGPPPLPRQEGLRRPRSSGGGGAGGDAATIPADAAWFQRGRAAFLGLNRTDPEAVWSFQGFAFEFWKSTEQASWLKGFVSAVEPGRFSIVDMDYGFGQWQKFAEWWGGGAAFFGANFIWTSLHNFGGTDGLKGNLSKVDEMPFAALEAGHRIWGTGFTSEGIDQNPAYYDLLIEAPWRAERPAAGAAAALAARAQRRYGLASEVPEVTASWQLLATSMYAQDVSVQDDTGVAHVPGSLRADFAADRRTPSRDMCSTFEAWWKLLAAAPRLDAAREPFRYDLVNLGRDVLARLSTPISANFSEAIGRRPPVAAEVQAAGGLYLELLGDLNALVGTDQAFLLGSWLSMARRFGEGQSDCAVPTMPEVRSCEEFYEWNARVQVTTWNPTPKGAAEIPGGPIDYAGKHWNGLVGDYYAGRVRRMMKLALSAAASKEPLDTAALEHAKAEWAFEWTTSFGVRYPEEPVGNATEVSQRMLQKYQPFFGSCTASSIAYI